MGGASAFDGAEYAPAYHEHGARLSRASIIAILDDMR